MRYGDDVSTEELVERYQRGEQAAGGEVVRRNQGLVMTEVRRFNWQLRTLGWELEDVVAMGNAGVVQALRRFDRSLGLKFSTYCPWWIRSEMQRALRAGVEGHQHVAYALWRGEEVSPRELATFRLRDALRRPSSTSRPVHLGEDESETLEDQLAADAPSPEDLAEASERAARVRDAMARFLRPRDRRILERRFGGREETLEEIARTTKSQRGGHLTRERVRQLEAAALERLRPHLEGLL